MARQRTKEFVKVANGKSIRVSSGTMTINTTQSGTALAYRSTCDDEVMPFFGVKLADHGLHIERYEKSYSNLNGRSSSDPLNYNEYQNYDVHYNRAFPSPILNALPSDGSSMATAMARSNPGRATIGLPTFIGEMKDLVPAIKKGGQQAIRLYRRARNRANTPTSQHFYGPKSLGSPKGGGAKALADAYITYRFAIAPLISDIHKLLDFQAQADKRCKELDRLYSKGGLRRRVELVNDTQEVQTAPFTAISNLGYLIKLRSHKITRVRRWATCRWLPTTPPSFHTDQEKHDLARSLVLGLNIQGLTMAAWNLLPWSWLADWFVNASDVLAASNNAVPATCVGRCLMTHVRTTVSYSRADTIDWCSGGDGMFTYETKHRSSNVGISLNTNLPFLNGSQLSILGALSVSKTR
jgi:hypothetical protein